MLFAYYREDGSLYTRIETDNPQAELDAIKDYQKDVVRFELIEEELIESEMMGSEAAE